jgi:hypothetical protein
MQPRRRRRERRRTSSPPKPSEGTLPRRHNRLGQHQNACGHFAGTPAYDHTKHGAFMRQADANRLVRSAPHKRETDHALKAFPDGPARTHLDERNFHWCGFWTGLLGRTEFGGSLPRTSGAAAVRDDDADARPVRRTVGGPLSQPLS